MSKRNPRPQRTAKVKQTFSYAESNSEDLYDMGWFDLVATAFQSSVSRRSRSSRRTKPRKNQRTPRKRCTLNVTADAPSVGNIAVPLSLSSNSLNLTTINLDDSVIADQSKKVEDKVESFFKIHNLISDDEDEGDQKLKYPPKDTKEFYELSDSEDEIKLNNSLPQHSISNINANEMPSTSYTAVVNKHSSTSYINSGDNLNSATICKTDELIDLVEVSPSKDDELMNIVNEILETTDKPIDLTNEKDTSWTDFKSKTEEILGTISNLLDGISKDAKPIPVEPEKLQPEIPKPSIPNCPVCLETLGGDVIVMTTVCGHLFCKPCITEVAKTMKKCPTCRKTVNQKKIHPIFL